MPILIDVVDAVVGMKRHRATYEVQLATPTGSPIGAVSVSKDSGYSDLLAWLVAHAPGPRLALSDPVQGPAVTPPGLRARSRPRAW